MPRKRRAETVGNVQDKRQRYSSDFWVRQGDDWLLEGETIETLQGPDYSEEKTPSPAKLSDGLKNTIKKINQQIHQCWPDQASDASSLWLVNGHAFYHNRFRQELEVAMCSRTDSTKAQLKQLMDQLDASANIPVVPQLERLLNMFTTGASNVKESCKKDIETAQFRRKELNLAKVTGKTCRTQAKWIGVERADPGSLEAWDKRCMVESDEQVALGLKWGAMTGDDYIRVDEEMNRVCAPDKYAQTMSSFIFWTKESSEDVTPTWDKVEWKFGGITYGLDKLDLKFGEDNVDVQRDLTGAATMIDHSAPVPRQRLNDAGSMVKLTGPHTTYGVPNNVEIPIPTTKSSRPRPATLKKISDAKVLRGEIKNNRPIMQSRIHSFLSGFLPKFAKQEQDAAKKGIKLRNILGYPNTSSFGTYAYCASPHLDYDDSPTSGLVMERDPSIQRDESNFVWASHRLVVELDHFCFWFWDAPLDHHGTTMNELALKAPNNYRDFIRKEPHAAQWTRVWVMTSKGVGAYSKED